MKEVSAALVRAQKEFGPALKTKKNPHLQSQYADLAACVEAVVDALNNNGIALTQRNITCESGVTVETVFVHESGETLSSGPLHIPSSKNDAQGYGSALTYARRYSLMAACGIAPEDDDGGAASKTKPKSRSTAQVTADQTKLTPEQVTLASEAGADIVSAFEAGKESEALAIWRSVTDNDMKVHIWAFLAGESKLRSFLKANKEK